MSYPSHSLWGRGCREAGGIYLRPLLTEQYMLIISKVGDHSRGWPEGSLFDSYSFPGLLHFTLDPYLIMLFGKQGWIKYHFFESLVWLDLGLNPGLPVGQCPVQTIPIFLFSKTDSFDIYLSMTSNFWNTLYIPKYTDSLIDKRIGKVENCEKEK